MQHQYITDDGEKANLSVEESNAFDKLLNLMRSSPQENSVEEFESLIKQYPKLVNAVHHNYTLTVLYFAADISNNYGLAYFKILLRYGATLDRGIINKIKYNHFNTYIMKDFLDFAYYYTKSADMKILINPTRFFLEQQQSKLTSTYGETTAESIENNDIPIVVKESGCSCTISMVHKVIYDNDLFNHPKLQKMLEVAKQKSMINELIDLAKDKDISDAITNAISETKHKIFDELFPNGVEDAQTLAEINSQLEDLSIEHVLNILLTQAPLSEPEIATPQQMIASTEQDSVLTYAYEFIQAVFENLESLSDAAKLLEILNFIVPTSGHQFISGFHGGNPDDDFGGGNINGAGIAFDEPLKDYPAYLIYPLPVNYTNFEAILVN